MIGFERRLCLRKLGGGSSPSAAKAAEMNVGCAPNRRFNRAPAR
jgi:hypothetical protein